MNKQLVDEMRAAGVKDVLYDLCRKEIYFCGNCDHEENKFESFIKERKYVADRGGAISETHTVPRLFCPACGEELEYRG